MGGIATVGKIYSQIRRGKKGKYERKYPLNENAFFDAENDPESAYWVGFLMADGCMQKGRYTLSLTLSSIDYDHLEKFQKFLKTDKPIYRYEISSFGKDKISHLSGIQIHSKIINEDLSQYGMTPCKSQTAKVEILEFNKHYWRGLIDGDGCLTYKDHGCPSLQLNGSKDSMEQFAAFVHKSVGRPARVYERKGVKCWRAMLCAHTSFRMIKLLYENAPVYLDRKMEKAKQIMKWCPKKGERLREWEVVGIWNSYYKEGMRAKEIAEKYEVDAGSVSNIVHGKAGVRITSKLGKL